MGLFCLFRRVIAAAGPGGEPRFGELYVDLVVLIGLTWNGIKRQLIVGFCIVHRLLQHGGCVIARIQRKTTRLGSEHLQGEVAVLRLIGLANTLKEALIVKGPETYIAGARRIDAVNGNSCSAKLSRKIRDHIEYVCLLLR